MTKMRMQGPDNCGGFNHAGVSYEPDDEGVIEVPGDVVNAALHHGFKQAAAKSAPKPLAKAAKGGDKEGVADETSGDGSSKAAEGGEPKDVKPEQKGAKAAKGGDSK